MLVSNVQNFQNCFYCTVTIKLNAVGTTKRTNLLKDMVEFSLRLSQFTKNVVQFDLKILKKGRVLIGPGNCSKKLNFKNEINISMHNFIQNLVRFRAYKVPLRILCSYHISLRTILILLVRLNLKAIRVN